MNLKYLDLLRCPVSGSILHCEPIEIVDGRVKSGTLHSVEGKDRYPIIDFIPRFVSEDHYAKNFSLEWNIHSRTQYDSSTTETLSRTRFFAETKWPENMSGEIILEAGCGAGRFTEHALSTGATVVSFDLSSAVDANYRSNGKHDKLLIVQASIYAIPCPKARFDRVFCFGVLQHTPDPHRSFESLIEYLKPGGSLAADIYLKNVLRWMLMPKYWIRPLTRRMEAHKLYDLVVRYVDFMWPFARLIRRIPKIGTPLNWRLLIGDYAQALPNADDLVLKQWAYLDTFDMLSPAYDYPQTVSTFRKWFVLAGLAGIDVHKGYNGVEGRGRKPQSSVEPQSAGFGVTAPEWHRARRPL